MNRTFIVVAVFLLLLLSSLACADEIKIATGHTFIKKVFDPVRCAFKSKTGLDIKIIYSDPAPALAELEKGNVDAAGASLALEEWLKLAGKGDGAATESGAYTQYTPTTEKLMIVVNAENRVKALSTGQLKEIFSGRISNWQVLGGDDAQILVVWPAISSGALVVFKNRIMNNEPLVKIVYDVESLADTADAVAATPEAIGIVTGNDLKAGIREIASAIERPLTLVYKGTPTPNLQKLLDFLKGEGNKYIK